MTATAEDIMFAFQSLQVNPKKVLKKLHDFELFCLGEKALSPAEFQTLNQELSIGAVLHIGKRRYSKHPDGKHLIWNGLDKREHDLGPVHKIDVMKHYPGFHKSSSLALGHDQVADNERLDIPKSHRSVSVVTMKDGSIGVGPNYHMALRNAALKMHLKTSFKKSNPDDAWKKVYAHA
ncbi:MAG: hypothetical protein ACPGRX_04295 [Bdellovibrionales bacterium]